MIAGPSGARMLRLAHLGRIVGLVVPLRLAALPFLEEVCFAFVVGVWEEELWAAVVLADCLGSATVMRLISVLLSISSNSSIAPVLLFRRRLKSVAFVLKGMRNRGFPQARWEALLSFGDAACRQCPCGPICSLHPWDGWGLPDLQGFNWWVLDSLDVLSDFHRADCLQSSGHWHS